MAIYGACIRAYMAIYRSIHGPHGSSNRAYMGAYIGHIWEHTWAIYGGIHGPHGSSNGAYMGAYMGHMGAAMGHVYAHTWAIWEQ